MLGTAEVLQIFASTGPVSRQIFIPHHPGPDQGDHNGHQEKHLSSRHLLRDTGVAEALGLSYIFNTRLSPGT